MATGGFKLSLASAKGKPGFKASLDKPAKRRRLALGDDEPEDTNAKQEITGWDAAEGGAVDANAKKEEPKGPRIIPALPNRNWRDEAQKRQLALKGAPAAENGNGEKAVLEERPKLAFGLTTFDKKEDHDDGKMPEPEPERMEVDEKVKEDTRTEEERLQAEALDILVNGKAASHAVIPISEEEALQNDLRNAPDAPTLAAYEATPIEGFGAALLRGMGWKDGESIGKGQKPAEKPKEIKRRPALLGIGAKHESAVGIELGEWGGGQKGKPQKKIAMKYNPVTLRNKHTGEMITEEELKEKLAKQKEVDEKAARNNQFLGDEDDEDERRRQKRRERKERERRDDDYDSERKGDKGRRDDRHRRKDRDDEHSDRRKDKKYAEYSDSDRDRHRDKKYRDDDYSSSDRRREKKYRDNDYDDRKYRERDRRRDRSRSPYDGDGKEVKREREREHMERSTDSKGRREKRRERSRSRDGDERRKKRREYDDYDDRKEERRSTHREDKYSRR